MKKYLSLLIALGILSFNLVEVEAISFIPKDPVIIGISGPQSLNINKTGTWTIDAYDPNGMDLHYYVDWGDVSELPNSKIEQYLTEENVALSQNAMFAHKYLTPGVYTPTFTVKNNMGRSATTSLSVNVKNTKKPLITIISPNGGETYKNGDKINVTWKTENIPSSFKFNVLRLRNIESFKEYNLLFGVKNDGKEKIKIPSEIPDGEYKLEIKASMNNVLVMDASDSYFKIISEDINQAPVISDVFGSKYLQIMEKGTWNVNAYDPNGGNLYYSVDWGDTNKDCVDDVCPAYASLERSPEQQSAVFTHSYFKEGVYKIKFTVRGDNGSTTETFLVKVGRIKVLPPSVLPAN